MGLVSFTKKLFLKRGQPETLSNAWRWMGNQSISGELVTSETAMRVSAVYTCVKILSESLASIPLNVYQWVGKDGRELAENHPIHRMLHVDRPNPLQNHLEFKELLQLDLCLRGNAYALVSMNARGDITELRRIHPDYIQPYEYEGDVVYQVISNKGSRWLRRDEVFHIKSMSADGLKGISPIDMAMETIGNAMSMQKHGSATFKNGARLGGILKYPGKLDAKGIESIRNGWQKAQGGSENSGKVAILENGMEFTPVSMTNEQGQWLDGMKFNRSEIFGMFRVPPHMGGDLERATFSNIEQQSIDFIQYTMVPWLTRWEAAITSSLFSQAEQKKYFVKFNSNAFLRGDGLSRAQKLNIERHAGIISANEWRALEEYNPLPPEAGDKYLIPMNMTDASKPQPDASAPGGQPPRTPGAVQQEPPSADANMNRSAAIAMLMPLIRDSLQRFCYKEANDQKRFRGLSDTEQTQFIQRNIGILHEIITPITESMHRMGIELTESDAVKLARGYFDTYSKRMDEGFKAAATVRERTQQEIEAFEKAIL